MGPDLTATSWVRTYVFLIDMADNPSPEVVILLLPRFSF